MKENTKNIYLSIRKLLAHTVSKLVPPHEIEDIVQETYVRLCQTEKADELEHPKSFMVTIARNLALDSLKRAERRLSEPLQDKCEEELPSSRRDELFLQASANEEFAHFCEAVRHLPVQCRKVFVLRRVYGLPQKEISEMLKISESTVEKHISSGMKRSLAYMQDLARETNISSTSEHLKGRRR